MKIDVGPRPWEMMGEFWSEKVVQLFCKGCFYSEDGSTVAICKCQCPICDLPMVILDGQRWEIELYERIHKSRGISIFEQSDSLSSSYVGTRSNSDQLTPGDIRKCLEEVDLLLANAGHPGTVDLSGALLAVNPETGLQKSAQGVLGLTVKAYDFIPEDEAILVDPFHLDRKSMSREEVESHIRSCAALFTGISEGNHDHE